MKNMNTNKIYEMLKDQLFDASITLAQAKSLFSSSRQKTQRTIENLSESKDVKNFRLRLLDKVGVGAYKRCFEGMTLEREDEIPTVFFNKYVRLKVIARRYEKVFCPLLDQVDSQKI